MSHIESVKPTPSNLVISTKDVAIATVTLGFPYDMSVTAHSKRDPHDRANEQIGQTLALARAYTALGRKLQKRADGLVKQADDNRKASDEAKKKKAEVWVEVDNPVAAKKKGAKKSPTPKKPTKKGTKRARPGWMEA